MVVTSDDGVHWRVPEGFQPFRGSVPDVLVRDDTLWVYAHGGVATFDYRTDQWAPPVPWTVTEGGKPLAAYDPSPVLDEDGRLVLFFLHQQGGGDPAACTKDRAPCTKVFRSATEVPGSHGTRFEADPGDRLALRIGARRSTSDPDVFHDGTSWVMYVAHLGQVHTFRSDTLRGTYLPSRSKPLTKKGLAVASGVFADGHYTTYVHGAAERGQTVIRRAVHPTLDPPARDAFEIVFRPQELPRGGPQWTVGSPGVARLSRPAR
jgi:hypothetical protein